MNLAQKKDNIFVDNNHIKLSLPSKILESDVIKSFFVAGANLNTVTKKLNSYGVKLYKYVVTNQTIDSPINILSVGAGAR